ncbi:MAG: hypothetical protein WAV86_06665 [Lutibacter sp.]
MYDFQRDIKNYTEKQLTKHLRRHTWLVNNIEQLSVKFNKKINNFKVRSIVIATYQLPIKFIEKVKIPIFSFNEIKRREVF